MLKHQIPIKTDRWNLNVPGFTEIDLVSHSGSTGEDHYIHSLNLTDIHTAWVEISAIMGRGQERMCEAIGKMRAVLPFELKGVDSDNESEFINNHLFQYCQRREIQFTRGKPCKKDDNAHIEQKNWTHVRKIFGYERYESEEALSAMNDLYINELALLQNLFQPSVRLVRKVQVGSKVRRIYDCPQTPLQTVCASGKGKPERIAELQNLVRTLNPLSFRTGSIAGSSGSTALHRGGSGKWTRRYVAGKRLPPGSSSTLERTSGNESTLSYIFNELTNELYGYLFSELRGAGP